LTKIDENETAIMPMNKGITVGIGAVFFMVLPFRYNANNNLL
jgi:hypothetical protein